MSIICSLLGNDSVIPLINAFEKRLFNGRKLENVAIQHAFYQGTLRGIKDIVEKFHEHPAITSERYAIGLIVSWKDGNSKKVVVPFLLTQADQGDLKEVKKYGEYEEYPEFRKAIDDAFQKPNLQEVDMIVSLIEKESGLPRRHLLKLQALSYWFKRKDLETSF